MKFASIKFLQRRTLRDIAYAQLVEAQLLRMGAQTALEYAKAAVDQHNATVSRLKALLSVHGEIVELPSAS